jgi:class 3 adenylate cyclase
MLGMLENDREVQRPGWAQEEALQETLLLVARLTEARGGDLDDAAILAVAETTGTSVDVVRMALRSMPKTEKAGPLRKVRNEFLALDPDVRRYAMGAWLGIVVGVSAALAEMANSRDQLAFDSLMQLVAVVATLCAVYNSAVSRSSKTGMLSGAIFAGSWFVSQLIVLAFASMLLRADFMTPSAILLAPALVVGLAAGAAAHALAGPITKRLGLQNTAQERQELLRQLVQLQDQLRSGERAVSFVSVDMVGSTHIKAVSDPLAVEFTFNEFHRYLEAIARKHGGRVHSTAGDGATIAFDHPQQAFAAARNMQSALFELNLHRNKLGIPIRVRVGVHSGMVVVPAGGGIQGVNFAHVIDVAAHLQKHCPPDGIVISDAAASFLPGGAASVSEDSIVVSDVKARIWRPRTKLEMPANGTS